MAQSSATAGASRAAGGEAAQPAVISYERFAGVCAIVVGVVGFLYSVSFVILKNDMLSAVLLLAGGLLTAAVMVGLYFVLEAASQPFARLALLLGGAGATASALHAGSDLANAIHPPATLSDQPSAVDPRGLATFAMVGLAILLFSWLIVRSDKLPATLGFLGYVVGVLMIIIYLGRLIVLSASNPLLLLPAALTGFIVGPIWYVWLGRELMRRT